MKRCLGSFLAAALLGSLTVGAARPAGAITFVWSFVNSQGSPLSGATTSGSISGLVEGVNDQSSPGLISAVVFSSENVPAGEPLTYWNLGAITVSNGAITSNTARFIDSQGRYVLNFDDLSYTNFLASPLAFDRGTAVSYQPASTAAAPGPLPLIGAAAAFRFSRRLRRRCPLRRAVSPVQENVAAVPGSR